jgi:hypothetical protein
MTAAGTAPTQRIKIQVLDAAGNPSGDPINAQFNPTSLQYTITNTAAQGSSRQKSRKVDESTGKLTMDLVFDTTDHGDDVRNKTQPIAMLMKPATRQLTPIIQISWGDIFKFKGALDSYRETLDFFSDGGVPLRASLSLGFTTVADNNATPPEVFAFASNHTGDGDANAFFQASSDDSFELPVGDDDSPSDIANALGDPGRARDIAAANGVEDLRNGSDAGDVLEVDDGVSLDPPVAFASGGASAGFGFGAGASFGASAGAGFGASAGAGFGASAGAGVSFGASASAGASFGASAGVTAGVSAGFGASASAGASFGASASASAGASFSAGASASASASFDASASFEASASASASGTFVSSSSSSFSSANVSVRAGSTASAHVSASEGAFARLRPPPGPSRGRIDVSRVLRVAASPRLVTDNPEAFGPGGQVVRVGASSTGTDVGASISLRDQIEFED